MIHEIHEAAHARHQAIGIRHDPRCPKCRDIASERRAPRVRVARTATVKAEVAAVPVRRRCTRRARRVTR